MLETPFISVEQAGEVLTPFHGPGGDLNLELRIRQIEQEYPGIASMVEKLKVNLTPVEEKMLIEATCLAVDSTRSFELRARSGNFGLLVTEDLMRSFMYGFLTDDGIDEDAIEGWLLESEAKRPGLMSKLWDYGYEDISYEASHKLELVMYLTNGILRQVSEPLYQGGPSAAAVGKKLNILGRSLPHDFPLALLADRQLGQTVNPTGYKGFEPTWQEGMAIAWGRKVSTLPVVERVHIYSAFEHAGAHLIPQDIRSFSIPAIQRKSGGNAQSEIIAMKTALYQPEPPSAEFRVA